MKSSQCVSVTIIGEKPSDSRVEGAGTNAIFDDSEYSGEGRTPTGAGREDRRGRQRKTTTTTSCKVGEKEEGRRNSEFSPRAKRPRRAVLVSCRTDDGWAAAVSVNSGVKLAKCCATTTAAAATATAFVSREVPALRPRRGPSWGNRGPGLLQHSSS